MGGGLVCESETVTSGAGNAVLPKRKSAAGALNGGRLREAALPEGGGTW